MELKEKLEILIKRNEYKKADFASAIGITYRALANYISGNRTPREKTISDMAALLGVPEKTLTDDSENLVLSSQEKLYFHGSSDKAVLDNADDILKSIDVLLSSPDFTEKDKTSFFNCVSEKYFASKAKNQK